VEPLSLLGVEEVGGRAARLGRQAAGSVWTFGLAEVLDRVIEFLKVWVYINRI
jgi:hypothetical protein